MYKNKKLCIFSFVISTLICFAGENHGGVAQLCFDLYILNPDGTKAKLTTSARRVGKNRIVTVKPHTKTYSYSSNSCSFIKTERWLRSPFPDGYMEIKAEADCLLKFEFTASEPPKGKYYWNEMKLFVDDKLVPENEFTVRYEKRNCNLPKIIKKTPYTYKRGKRKYTSYRKTLVAREVKDIPSPQNGGIIFNSYRRPIFTKLLKKGESFKHHFEVKAISEVEFK